MRAHRERLPLLPPITTGQSRGRAVRSSRSDRFPFGPPPVSDDRTNPYWAVLVRITPSPAPAVLATTAAEYSESLRIFTAVVLRAQRPGFRSHVPHVTAPATSASFVRRETLMHRGTYLSFFVVVEPTAVCLAEPQSSVDRPKVTLS